MLQFYPETEGQTAMLKAEAKKTGFGGGTVVDYPESKKSHLGLVAGSTSARTFSTSLGLQQDTDQKIKRRKDMTRETRKEIYYTKEGIVSEAWQRRCNVRLEVQ